MGMGKFEYTGVISNIILITEQLANIRRLLASQTIFYIAQKATFTQLIEIYLGILFLIEKYGGPDSRICQIYIILYQEIITLFHAIQLDNPQTTKATNKLKTVPSLREEHRLSSSLPSTLNSKPTLSDVFHIAFTKGLGGRELPENISTLSSCTDSEAIPHDMVSWTNSSRSIGFTVDAGVPLNTTPLLILPDEANKGCTDKGDLAPPLSGHTILPWSQWDNNTVNTVPVTLNSKPTSLFSCCPEPASKKEQKGLGEREFSETPVPEHWARNPVSTVPQGVDLSYKGIARNPRPMLLRKTINRTHSGGDCEQSPCASNWDLPVRVKPQHLKTGSTQLKAPFTFNSTIAKKIGDLGWLTQIIRPIEVNTFFETEPAIFHDLYSTFQELGIDKHIKNRQLCSINKYISNAYKALLAGLKCDSPIQFIEITNPNIIAGLKITDSVKDNLLHVIQYIDVSPGHRIWVIINGYIANQDPIICQQDQDFTKRYTTLCSNITSIPEINLAFKLNYTKLITLTQILTGATINIIKSAYDKWNLYGLIMEQSIQECITFFNNANIYKKQDILTVLLLCNKQASIFRAELLWNSLADSTEQADSNTIFNHLHYTIQHKLSNHFITQVNKSKDSEPDADLSYEHRIAISLADKATKTRMLDKLKEINNKTNENTSKATQYLDGLLSIPFGKYRKESIICQTDKFNTEISQFLSNLIIVFLDTYTEYACCYEYLLYICRVLELDVAIIKKLSLLDELAQEQSIQQLIKGKSIKVPLLEQLTCELSSILTQKMPVCPDQIDTCFLQSLLDGLEQTQLNQLYRNIKSTQGSSKSRVTPDFLLAYIENDKYARETMLDVLASDGHFYDIGYPANKLDKYQTKLLNFRQQYTELIQHKRTYLANCYSALDDSIYGQHDAKEQVIRIIGQWLNGNQGGYCLGFEGSPGVGKTSLAKYGISKALVDNNRECRPFGFIALGGSSNGSTLEGHSYTYVGSTWGRIVDILINAGCMNPIIFIDELDKISNTDNGRELIGILTHLTDKTQNNEFMDKYFSGVKIDLSQVLFIFSYNDYDKLDPILADRIHRIRFDNYTTLDKVTIAERYLIHKIITEINFMDLDISFAPGAITYLINSYTYEAGVRKLKEQLYDILRDINIRNIRGNLTKLAHCDNNHIFTISPDIIDNILLARQHKIDIPRPFSQPRIGVVYGLYATAMGIGGITIIQVSKKYTDTGTALLCTGKQGDVMNESIKVGLTLAINILPKTIRDKLVAGQSNDNNAGLLKNYSFHIHCPDGSTPKDGPSAGCAFTVGLVSILTSIPVLNTVSMTGEVDIMGRVLPIGGLDSKIQGSAKSGITKILVPADNKRDIDRIMLKQPEILDNITICFVDNILDVLQHSLLDAGLFN